MNSPSPFTDQELDAIARSLGLILCTFPVGHKNDDQCSHASSFDFHAPPCPAPFGRCWAAISRGEDFVETDYYIGDCCLPLQQLRERREANGLSGGVECWHCHGTAWLAKPEPFNFFGQDDTLEDQDTPEMCPICFGFGELYTPPHFAPFARARAKYEHCARQARLTSGRRRRHWQRAARRWHATALHLA